MRRSGSPAIGALLALGVAATAAAQEPPPLSPPEIASCLCLRRALDASSADMTAKQQALSDVRARLDRATRELDAARNRMDVNDAAAVARFREMLAGRDELFRRANGPAVGDAASAVERYNRRSDEYNSRCANRTMDAAVVAKTEATLVCPAPY